MESLYSHFLKGYVHYMCYHYGITCVSGPGHVLYASALNDFNPCLVKPGIVWLRHILDGGYQTISPVQLFCLFFKIIQKMIVLDI